MLHKLLNQHQSVVILIHFLAYTMDLPATVELALVQMPSIIVLTVATTPSINQLVRLFEHANQMENGMVQYLTVTAVSDTCALLFLFATYTSM